MTVYSVSSAVLVPALTIFPHSAKINEEIRTKE